MKSVLIATVLTLSFAAAPAFADCVGDIKRIEDAMKTTTLDEAGMKSATDNLTKAKAAAEAKDEKACTTSTAELMKMLGLKV
jgi:opacity protein-like surface antigen